MRPELPGFDDYDLVLVADFGHGLLDARKINRTIAEKKRTFVAAMAQVNSSNYGYNLPTKYVGADYYSASTFNAPETYSVVTSNEQFYEISFNHRIAFVRATDVDTVS